MVGVSGVWMERSGYMGKKYSVWDMNRQWVCMVLRSTTTLTLMCSICFTIVLAVFICPSIPIFFFFLLFFILGFYDDVRAATESIK
ncbi:hypothetical protein BDV28DRAFT_137960 [Aspergillus coremiiformis]|uniref:Uncharacterized protein n=1 Tax=Aspergillus coremiiformis TaxID=138285 RepID=A0A5N6Z052_9EURO|nr:hypothetical protein BDV28DRAFT_137960 [Aspergillus coremiiformis]